MFKLKLLTLNLSNVIYENGIQNQIAIQSLVSISLVTNSEVIRFIFKTISSISNVKQGSFSSVSEVKQKVSKGNNL